jgi:hypothetical protein
VLAPRGLTLVDRQPGEPGWLQEVKEDGFRVLARKPGELGRVELLCRIRDGTRIGNRWLTMIVSQGRHRRNLPTAWPHQLTQFPNQKPDKRRNRDCAPRICLDPGLDVAFLQTGYRLCELGHFIAQPTP